MKKAAWAFLPVALLFSTAAMGDGIWEDTPAQNDSIYTKEQPAGEIKRDYKPPELVGFYHEIRTCKPSGDEVRVAFSYGSLPYVMSQEFQKKYHAIYFDAPEAQRIAWIDDQTKAMDAFLKKTNHTLPSTVFGLTSSDDWKDVPGLEDVLNANLTKAVTSFAAATNRTWPGAFAKMERIYFRKDAPECTKVIFAGARP